jgi:ABC-type dipeptide/oligopeptide/nickel transport system permease component
MGQALTALPNTLTLVLTSLVLATCLSLSLAIFSVRHRESALDLLVRRSVSVLQGVPEFWLALMLILLFSVQAGIFPSFGYTTYSALVLPTIALAVPITPTLFRLFRGQLLDVMGASFVESMRVRGINDRAIVYRHVLRNILGPASTLIALQLGYLISGSVVVETIFSWPGLGNLLVSSIQARNITVVQAGLVLIAGFYIVLNLAADVIVISSDPRVRTGKS